MTAVPAGKWLRVSTAEQAEAAQEPEIDHYIASHGYKLTETYRLRGESAFHGHQEPELRRMLEDIRSGRIEVLVCWHSDRLERRGGRELLNLLAEVRQAGGRVESVKEPQLGGIDFGGQVVTFIAGLTAHQESQHKSERVKLAHADHLSRGALWGKPPFGYQVTGDRKSKTLVPTDTGRRYVPEAFADATGIAPASERGLSLGRHLRGVLTGDWRGAEREQEYMQRAMGGSSVGGLLPVAYSSELVDLARVQTQVLNAGGQLVPLSARSVVMPVWQTDPTVAFRSEGGAVNQSDAALGSVTFTAQSLAGYTTISRELIEDTDLSDLLANAYSKAVAIAWDNAALLGSGTAPSPRGLKNFTSVTDKSAVVTNGQTPTWDNLIDMVGGVLGRNEQVSAIIYHPRNELALGKVKDSQQRYLDVPRYLANVPRLTTGTLPVNEVEGTSGSVCNSAFAGDFSQLFIGVRTNFGVNVYDAPAATTGQVLMVAWMRLDIQIGRPTAFAIRTGLKA